MTTNPGWIESMPEIYDRCLGPALFSPYAAHLAARAAALAPARVLEIAAGTGIVTAELVRALPQAAITATDLSPDMVAWAAARVAGPSWSVADAQHLEFPDAAFDLVVCQFGVMFFPDKPGAFAQVRRVIAPGGTFLGAVWDRAESSDFPAALVAGIATALPTDPPDFIVRGPHGYFDPARIRADVEAGGLRVEAIERVVLRGSAPSAQVVAEGYCLGSPLRFALEPRGPLPELTERIGAEMARTLGPGPVQSDLAAWVITARA